VDLNRYIICVNEHALESVLKVQSRVPDLCMSCACQELDDFKAEVGDRLNRNKESLSKLSEFKESFGSRLDLLKKQIASIQQGKI
jgi:hypothetical protein